MRAAPEKRPGILYNFSQPIKDCVEESISRIRGQVVVKIYGEDLTLMQAKLEEIRRILIGVRGSRDVEVYRAGRAQHIVSEIDRESIARVGLQVRDVEDMVESAYGGKLATSIWDGERKVDVRVKLPRPPKETHFPSATSTYRSTPKRASRSRRSPKFKSTWDERKSTASKTAASSR